MPDKTPFPLEAMVDFLDDALTADHPLTESDLDGMMRLLAASGVKRVSWAYYADGRGGLLMPAGIEDGTGSWANCRATYRELGNPLRAAVAAGHRHGLDVYGYYKPYETGTSLLIPEGSPDARAYGLLPHKGGRLGLLDPFVAAHPDLRIRRRSDDLPAVPGIETPVRAIRLVKKDATPTRITAEHLQIWTSPDNFSYRRATVPFTLADTVEPAARDVRNQFGTVVTRRGDPVRVLTLSGLNLTDAFILVTTDFETGPADFSNTGLALLAACDAGGREIPGVSATGGAVWLSSRVDFRHYGLVFDFGWSKWETTLDAPNADGRSGLIAFARGKNEFLPAALCETEPEVQAFWLDCLREIVAAGVDGVDFREENHCTHTDEPEAYGFNPVVLAQCQPGEDLLSEVARVRGNAYTGFLRQAKSLLAANGVRMRYHLNMDYFRPNPPGLRALAFPANLHFDWRTWLKEGLLDEAVLRSYHYRTAMLTDPVGTAMVEACRSSGVPISHNHHVFADESWYLEEAVRVAGDGRFAGLILYEVNSFLRFGRGGECQFPLPVAEAICRELGKRGSRA
jgi:hypothetical protein